MNYSPEEIFMKKTSEKSTKSMTNQDEKQANYVYFRVKIKFYSITEIEIVEIVYIINNLVVLNIYLSTI